MQKGKLRTQEHEGQDKCPLVSTRTDAAHKPPGKGKCKDTAHQDSSTLISCFPTVTTHAQHYDYAVNKTEV